MDLPLLSLMILLPLLGAGLTLLVKDENPEIEARNARQTAFWASLVTLVLAIYATCMFSTNTAAMQFEEKHVWIEPFNIHYHLGVDGISILFVLLTALLTPICILVSWESIQQKVKAYMSAFLALEAFVIGVFCALDFVLFYVLWEAMLIPMFLIIGIWGGENRVYAALKFFLYTFAGSVLMLVAMFYFYHVSDGSFNILELAQLNLPEGVQKWLWLALFAAFAVKVPMWPFHTWLPDAHVQAPTAGSVILAGVLLKMGAYGFLRFSLPILPEASIFFTPMVMVLSVIAILYTALVAFAQTDVKKMIAYSSVSHMGFVTMGIFSATAEGVQGAILQMLNHGIVSAALFMLIGVVYTRMHTRELGKFGGIVHRMPRFVVIMMVFTMAAVGLPGTNSFVGEFLILMGTYQTNQWAVILGSFGVVLGALYMLHLYRKMVLGEITTAAVKRLKDIKGKEVVMFLPLLFLVFWIGFFPTPWLRVTEASVLNVLHQPQTTTHAPAPVLLPPPAVVEQKRGH